MNDFISDRDNDDDIDGDNHHDEDNDDDGQRGVCHLRAVDPNIYVGMSAYACTQISNGPNIFLIFHC